MFAVCSPASKRSLPVPEDVHGEDFQSKLTQKEAKLLAILQENPGICLSRNYLLKTVWGYREGVRTRTVDVHIQRLRRKLGADGERCIKTIFRSGYIWHESNQEKVFGRAAGAGR
jgi:DNA-binding response OmpR family regulator